MPARWIAFGCNGRVALVGSVALALAGCSTVHDMSGIPRPGYQKDGTYVMSAEEQNLGCRALQERQLGLQEEMAALPQKALTQMQELPNTVARAFQRLVGNPGAVPAVEEYNEAKAESAAVSASLAQKGCNAQETAAIRQ